MKNVISVSITVTRNWYPDMKSDICNNIGVYLNRKELSNTIIFTGQSLVHVKLSNLTNNW